MDIEYCDFLAVSIKGKNVAGIGNGTDIRDYCKSKQEQCPPSERSQMSRHGTQKCSKGAENTDDCA